MAALTFIVGSVCSELARIVQVLFRTGGSFSQCWDYVVENRERQLLDRYIKWLDRGGGGGDGDEFDGPPAGAHWSGADLRISIGLRRKHSWILAQLRETLQREPMDDEVDDFVDIATDIVEWEEVKVSIILLL